MNEELKKKLEEAHRILHREGLAEDASRGHITAKSEDGKIYVKPWGTGFQEVKAADFQGLDESGNLVEGKGRIHSEVILHLEIYRKRKDVLSVVHVHPYYSILLSSVFKGKISVVSQQGVRFTGKIPFYTVGGADPIPGTGGAPCRGLGRSAPRPDEESRYYRCGEQYRRGGDPGHPFRTGRQGSPAGKFVRKTERHASGGSKKNQRQ